MAKRHDPREPHDHNDFWDVADTAELVWLIDFHKCSYAEAAKRLGRSVGAVRSKLYRLRNQEAA